MELDFTFAKQSAVITGPQQLQRSDSTGSDDQQKKAASALTSPIEFASMPSNLKIPANGSGILNIAAKLRNSYQLASIKDDSSNTQSSSKKKQQQPRPEKYNHLLIAKVKDT